MSMGVSLPAFGPGTDLAYGAAVADVGTWIGV